MYVGLMGLILCDYTQTTLNEEDAYVGLLDLFLLTIGYTTEDAYLGLMDLFLLIVDYT